MSGPEGSSIKNHLLCVVVFLFGGLMDTDIKFMKAAYKQAEKAEWIDEVPIGAVIVKDGKIIARAYNQRETKQQATKHAEIIAIEKACRKLGTWRLEDCDLYVTLEPCIMCTGAIINARIRRVIYGASEKRWLALSGLLEMTPKKQFNHHVTYTSGILESECSKQISDYFKKKRKAKK